MAPAAHRRRNPAGSALETYKNQGVAGPIVLFVLDTFSILPDDAAFKSTTHIT
jgi:hypothetical protein